MNNIVVFLRRKTDFSDDSGSDTAEGYLKHMLIMSNYYVINRNR